MPDFQTLVVRAPYWAEFVLGRKRERIEVDEPIEAPIESWSLQDTTRAALVKLPKPNSDDHWIDFLDAGGRLFRPFIDDYKPGLWTVERCRNDPPQMAFDMAWGFGIARTTLLGSPFRASSSVDVPEHYRRRARRAAPEALAEARQCAEAHIARGLIFVDGVLYQETRTPGWAVCTPDVSEVSACLPDLTRDPGLTLIDPRHPIGEIDEMLAPLGYDERMDTIQVVEPSLLPATTEADALASLCVHVQQRLSDLDLRQVDRKFFVGWVSLMDDVERALRDDQPLDGCYAAIERLAEWVNPAPIIPETEDVDVRMQFMSDAAQHFLAIRRRFPPLDAAPVDEHDADAIAKSFKP